MSRVNLTSSFGVFGTRTRTNILLLLTLLEESHSSELARLLDVSLSTVQNSLDTLEQASLVAGTLVGRERRVRINPRFFARTELRNLLDKMALHDGDLQNRVATLRRRPRRSGKSI